ncbi:unnamed protein product [Spirodela intermedia]|uniref:Uncharacterized protein n=1 Tax=Spirodela intermedia TaxID=51605 RepID=A0A7I8IUF8_SPIIN|nr:unnamed protein product [Spirodela intermedia]CAA6661250.1 unnamed protein product [Spirodela intermedia]
MEIFPVQFCRNITMMSGRRYQRLEDGKVVGDRWSRRVVKLGGGGGRNKKKLGNGGAAGGRGDEDATDFEVLLPHEAAGPGQGLVHQCHAGDGREGRPHVGLRRAGALWSKRVPKGRPAAPPRIDFDTRILIETKLEMFFSSEHTRFDRNFRREEGDVVILDSEDVGRNSGM